MERLGRYDLLEYIAEDPPWRLFRARRVADGGPYRAREGDVVFRLLARVPSDDVGRARLARARVAVELKHPHIGRVLEWEHDEPNCVTELVKGWRLHHLIDRDLPLALSTVCMIARQVCEGLHYLHQHPTDDGGSRGAGIAHRAVRPHRVLITTAGAAVLDNPGLLMVRRREPALLSVSSPTVYKRLSPEQTFGSVPDHRSDIFQVGLMLYEMLTGHALFSRGSPFDTVTAIRSAPAPRPSQVRADVPAGLDTVCARALAKSTDDRYQTARELALELEALAAAQGWDDGKEQLFEQLQEKEMRAKPRVAGLF